MHFNNNGMIPVTDSTIGYLKLQRQIDAIFGVPKLTPEERANLENLVHEINKTLSEDDLKEDNNVIDINRFFKG